MKGKKQELVHEDLPTTRVTATTDDLGFSFIDKRRLLKSDGSSTLQDAQQRLAVPESAHILKSKYTIETTDDGKSSVRWTNWNRTPKSGPATTRALGKRDGRDGGTPVRRGRPPKFAKTSVLDDRHSTLVPKPKRLKFDENGALPQTRPRGRPRLPDHLLKKPRKPRKAMEPMPIEEKVVAKVQEGAEQATNEQIVPIEEAIVITEAQKALIANQTASPGVEMENVAPSGDFVRNTHDIHISNLVQQSVKVALGVPVEDDTIPPRSEKVVPETHVSSKLPLKRRGRPPKNGMVYGTPSKGALYNKRSSRSSAKTTSQSSTPAQTPAQLHIAAQVPPEQDAILVQTVEEILSLDRTCPVKARCTSGGPGAPKLKNKVQKESEALDITMTDAPITGSITLTQESPLVPIQVSCAGEYIRSIKGTKDVSKAPSNSSPQGTPQRASRSIRFSASVDAMEEAMAPNLMIPPEEIPSSEDSSLVSPSQPMCQDLLGYHPAKSISRATEATPVPVTKGGMHSSGESSIQRLPRTEPTMALEEVDDTSKMSYGSAGGMLMIARQRVILELMEENGGVFPGGLEIKHAFESRYKRKNPKAGQPDRRLMVSLVSSLQRSGKINQIVINFINSRGLRQTKRILADSKLPLDHPLILEMKNSIVSADGNLWFPIGTEIPKEVQKLASSTRGLPTDPGSIESVEFERIYTPQRQLLKSQRAEASRNKRLERIEHQHEFPRFTAQQKELAAKRLEMRRRRAAFSRIKPTRYTELRGEDVRDAHFDQWEIKEVPSDLVDRPDVREFSEIINFIPAPSLDARALLHKPTGLPEPHQEEDCERGIRTVYKWEEEQLLGGEEVLGCYSGFNMINHFAPPAKILGTSFTPEKVSMSNLIYQPDFRKGKSNPFAAKKYSSHRKTGSKTLEVSEGMPKPKRRRIVGPLKLKKTRREQAMAELHHGAEAEEDTTLQEVPPKTIIPRKRHSFDYEQDDVLLAAIVIVRTLFGGFDRRIDWNLVATVFPDYDMATLKARWPRVRDAHKTHLKKLQIDFEEVYLDAYGRGLMPEITRGEIGDFDLPWHCRWFKDNVAVPDAKSIPALTQSRDTFNLLYDLRAEKPSWRDEYHNSALTGQNRINFLSSHPYEVQLIETKTDRRSYEDGQDVECIKGLIKANVLTDASVYDARKAYEILSSFPVSTVDTAFYFLTGNKTLAPKKDAEKLVPGRNYEFTERFHLSLRVPLGGRIWAQAAAFENLMDQEFTSNRNDQGVGKLNAVPMAGPREFSSTGHIRPTMVLSPFMNDGSMMCLLNLVAHQRITLDKSRYVSNINGLVKGYRTRSMERAMIDFPITISPTHLYYTKPLIALPPEVVANSPDWTQVPVRVWYDIMGNLVQGMWKKVVAAVLGTVTGRPGIGDAEVSRILCPGVTIAEVEMVCDWLAIAGVLLRREVNGVKASFVKEGFWWGLLGQMDREKIAQVLPGRDDG